MGMDFVIMDTMGPIEATKTTMCVVGGITYNPCCAPCTASAVTTTVGQGGVGGF